MVCTWRWLDVFEHSSGDRSNPHYPNMPTRASATRTTMEKISGRHLASKLPSSGSIKHFLSVDSEDLHDQGNHAISPCCSRSAFPGPSLRSCSPVSSCGSDCIGDSHSPHSMDLAALMRTVPTKHKLASMFHGL